MMEAGFLVSGDHAFLHAKVAPSLLNNILIAIQVRRKHDKLEQ